MDNEFARWRDQHQHSGLRHGQTGGFTMNGLTAARPQEGAADSSNLSSPTARRVQIQSTWRQPKFVVGCALIVASVVMGALIVGAADDRVMVWSATRDLAAGTVVTSDDLAEVAVAMDQAGRYLSSAQTSVLGRRTSRALGKDELVALSAVAAGDVDTRLITVPVEPVHAPTDLAHGDRVDVYSSPRDAATAGGSSRLVLTNVLVSQLSTDVDTARGELAVVLDVRADQAAAIVTAARTGVLDLVRVPVGAA